MPEPAFNEQNQLILSLICITAIIASGILYARTGQPNDELGLNGTNSSVDRLTGINPGSNLDPNNPHDGIRNITKKKIIYIIQPSCPPLKKYEEFKEICTEMLFNKYSCTPEDVLNPAKHKIPKYYYQHTVRNNSNNETQNTIVNCIIAALLLTSLGAALLEFYRAKLSPPPENGKRGTLKAPVNRKCSLADLTVLKHHRKELVRRESILESHNEEASGSGGGSGNAHQGLKPYPLHRRCSFPASLPSNEGGAGGTAGGFPARRNSRKYSMTGGDINRRLSVVVNDGGRKLSIVADESNVWRRGSIVGEDSSPERRHHSRLVHRH